MPTIDLNCDMGESTLEERMVNDLALMDLVTSVNIACGFHAGNRDLMRRTAAAAIERGVAVGAHPSYPDPENFGRSDMDLPESEVFEIVSEQIATMKRICEESGGTMTHVKPHGALYNKAAKSAALSSAIASAVRECDPDLILFGLSGSFLISEAEKAGLYTASEVFADRTYQSDGSLTPRSRPDALIDDTAEAVGQVLRMANEKTVSATDGAIVAIVAETVCIHGDGRHALEFARALRAALTAAGISIRRPAR